ncbi:hypothetical protein HDV05_006192 [Chytridiales sp. JEL 0842]|nr:hypothetical protein HDV05_006192 [Chytridiales sp. JEL 0842]
MEEIGSSSSSSHMRPVVNETSSDKSSENPQDDDYLCAIVESLKLYDDYVNSTKYQKSNADGGEAASQAYCLELYHRELEEEKESIALARSVASCADIDNRLLELFAGEDELEMRDRQLAAAIRDTGRGQRDPIAEQLLRRNIAVAEQIIDHKETVSNAASADYIVEAITSEHAKLFEAVDVCFEGK